MNPFTDRNEMATLYKLAMNELISSPPKDITKYFIRTTSGTTGSGPLHMISPVITEVFDRYKGYKNILACPGSMSIRFSAAYFVRYGHIENQRILCINPQDIGPDLENIIDDFKPELLHGVTSLVVSFAAQIQTSAMRNIQKLILVGEYFTSVLDDFFSQHFSPETKVTLLYASSETSAISKPACGYLPKNSYHPCTAFTIDIDEPDEQGVGSLLFSWKFFKDFSAIRYKIGDSGKLIHETCPCGESVTLQVAGRTGYDYLKVAGALLHKEEFDRVSKLFPTYIDTYRAEAFLQSGEKGLQGGVVLKVYRAAGTLTDNEKAELAQSFSDKLFLTPTQTLQNLVEKGIFIPLLVEESTTPFPKGNKDITLKMRP